MNHYSALKIVALACVMTVSCGPLWPKYDKKAELYAFNSLWNPVRDIACRMQTLSHQFHMERIERFNLKREYYKFDVDYPAEYQKKCVIDFGSSSANSVVFRMISAMKQFQKLVGLLQDIQVSESGIHYGDETPFVRDFRHVEYKLRELVEDHMRNAAFEFFDAKSRTGLPPYSVGGLTEKLDDAKSKDPHFVNFRNREKMTQIEKCLKIFLEDTILKVVGQGDKNCPK